VAIAERTLSSNTATTNGATTLSVSPTGMQENDWLVFWVVSAGGTGAHSNTAGSCTRVHNDLAGGTTIVTSSWKKKCGASEAGPYTFDFGGSTRRAVIIARAYSGCDSTDAVEAAPTQTTDNPVTSLAVTGVDPASTGGLHIVLQASRAAGGASQSFTPPTNYTEKNDLGTSHATNANAFAAWAERALPDANATGDQTFTAASSERLNGGSILLKEGASETPISLSDTGAGADAVTVTVTLTVTDTGSGADAVTVAASATLAETATAGDQLGANVGAPLGDTASGTDAASVSATVGLAETASGADALSVVVQAALSEAAAALDALGVTATLTLTDTGTASDTVTAVDDSVANKTLTDVAVGADCICVTILRPSTGQTVRPSTGVVARPDTGVVKYCC
jgi:hypothetical protein